MGVEAKLGKGVAIAEQQRSKEPHAGFVADLFRGKMVLDHLFRPPTQLTTNAQRVVDIVERLLSMEVDAIAIDEDNEVPQRVLDLISEHRLYGLKIPLKYGGWGLTQGEYAQVLGRISSQSGALTALISAANTIGAGFPVKKLGTKWQKEHFLPTIVRNPTGFAFTEREAGSDPASMQSYALRVYEGGELVGYRIYGEKLWTTNGPKSDTEMLSPLLCLVVRTVDDPAELEDPNARPNFSVFILETDHEGVEIVQRCDFAGLNGIYNGVTRINGVYVDKRYLLGEEEGTGFSIALAALNTGRLSLASAVVAATKQLLLAGQEWASGRVQWGKPIIKHELIGSGFLAKDMARTFALEAMVDLTTRRADAGEDCRIEAAICKVAASEWGFDIIDNVVQVFGGRGWETARSLAARGELPLPVEEAWRSSRINRVFEGATQILILWAIREAIDEYKQMGEQVQEGSMGQKLGAVKGLAGRFASQYVPESVDKDIEGILPKELRSNLKYIEKTTRRLVRSVFMTMGREQARLIHKQLTFERWFWIATNLYGMAAACFYAAERGDEDSIALANLFCREARGDIAVRFRELKQNTDKRAYRVSKRIDEGAFTNWLSEGILPWDMS